MDPAVARGKGQYGVYKMPPKTQPKPKEPPKEPPKPKTDIWTEARKKRAKAAGFPDDYY